jgi:hypothetical protein
VWSFWHNYPQVIDDYVRIEGHSLGAIDAVVLYQLGLGNELTTFALPYVVPTSALTTGRTGSAVHYMSDTDWIADGPAFATDTVDSRIASGANVVKINTGTGWFSGDSPHDRIVHFSSCACLPANWWW